MLFVLLMLGVDNDMVVVVVVWLLESDCIWGEGEPVGKSVLSGSLFELF